MIHDDGLSKNMQFFKTKAHGMMEHIIGHAYLGGANIETIMYIQKHMSDA